MKIYFMRHGDPNYKNDCLTELGHKQAKALAERLSGCGIEQIYSSTNGRAMQTAEYTASRLGLTVTPLDYMREIGWKPIGDEPLPEGGNPWHIADLFAAEGRTLTDPDWRAAYPFSMSVVSERYPLVTGQFDALLAELGYVREGENYRACGAHPYHTVAVFSHGGSSSAVLSHILNIPFPQICGMFRMACTSVIVVELSDEEGVCHCPRLLLFNDMRHTEELSATTYDV